MKTNPKSKQSVSLDLRSLSDDLVPAYFSLFQSIPAYFSHVQRLQPFTAISSLFKPN